LNLGLQPYTVNKVATECGKVDYGLGPCARASDGKVYPQYIAEDLCMEVDLEYDINALPREKNHLVSFSIVGALQNGNTTPLTPPGEYGYDWQVARYLALYANSTSYAIPEKDIFMYTDVGANDLINLLTLITNGQDVDYVSYLNKYKNQVLKNVVDLYSLGKARRMFVQLTDTVTIYQTPFYQVFACIIPNISDIMEAYEKAQSDLLAELESFASEQPHFDLTVVTTFAIYENLSINAGEYGIINGKTMIELGWPNKTFENQLWFDSFNLSSHSNRVVANYVKTWFQQRICTYCADESDESC
jgi:hypothetical protein